MRIRAELYKAAPFRPPADIDRMELWQVGVMLGNDVGATPTESEQAEIDELKAKRLAALKRVTGGG